MIKAILGPMRSGKSLLLLREAEKLHLSKKSYVILRNKKDKRTFISRSFKPTIKLNFEYYNSKTQLELYDYILIDEFHLFDTGIIKEIIDASINGKTIITSGLLSGSDIPDKPIDLMLLKQNVEFLPFVDEIVKLKSICENCGNSNGNIEYTDSKEITIGDNYKILCLKCAKNFGIISKYFC